MTMGHTLFAVRNTRDPRSTLKMATVNVIKVASLSGNKVSNHAMQARETKAALTAP
jgi:hypothetical protein